MPTPRHSMQPTYAVHELLLDDEPRTAQTDAQKGHHLNVETLREVGGMDIACDR